MTAVLECIAAQGVVPVLRSADVADAIATTRACARAGMSVIELTRTTPDVEEALHALREDELTLGLGTVTDAAQVAPAIAAGARFVVSFTSPAGMIPAALALGAAVIPGALTPTEIAACERQGATAVKLFPGRVVAPSYLRDLRAVLPELRMLVTGGVRGEDIESWLAAGALAVGLGGQLGTVAEHGAAEVERRARALLDVVRRCRSARDGGSRP
jgi:2-dehydro-3-deoxyphosphogluconate aldolase/(4S)-4-hydroxy-2-oxoglutarate aldolase